MTVVIKPSTTKPVTVSTSTSSSGSLVVKKAGEVTIQGLKNVDSTDLQDNYTLVYDSATNKWVTRRLSSESLQIVDGGTY